MTVSCESSLSQSPISPIATPGRAVGLVQPSPPAQRRAERPSTAGPADASPNVSNRKLSWFLKSEKEEEKNEKERRRHEWVTKQALMWRQRASEKAQRRAEEEAQRRADDAAAAEEARQQHEQREREVAEQRAARLQQNRREAEVERALWERDAIALSRRARRAAIRSRRRGLTARAAARARLEAQHEYDAWARHHAEECGNWRFSELVRRHPSSPRSCCVRVPVPT